MELEDRSGVNWHVQVSDITDVTYIPRLMHWGGALCTCTMTSDVKYYRNPASSSCTVTLGLWTPDSRSDLTQSVESLRPYCMTQRLASVHTTPQPDHFEITTEVRYGMRSQADPIVAKSHRNAVHFQSNKGCCTSLWTVTILLDVSRLNVY